MGIFLIGVSVGMVVGMLFMTLFAVSAQAEDNMEEMMRAGKSEKEQNNIEF